MSIKKQIHALIIKRRELTMKEIVDQIGCSRDSARPALCRLKAEGVIKVTRTGSHGERLYSLGESVGVTVRSKNTIEQCKENWQGYHIHKIFGSSGRVAA